MSKRLLTILLVLAALSPLATSFAQSTLPPEYERAEIRRQVAQALSKANLQTAKDYQDFIGRLQLVAEQYEEYYSGIKDLSARKYEAAMQALILQINRGDYCTDIEALSEDLEYLIDGLHEHEAHAKEIGNKKLYKTSKSLRRELEVLLDELNDEILVRLIKEANRELVEEYLVEQRESVKDSKEIYEKTLVEHQALFEEIQKTLEDLKIQGELLDPEQLEALKELEELEIKLEELEFVFDEPSNLIILHPEERTPDVVVAPVPPVPPTVIIGPKEYTRLLESGKTGVVKEYIDSIKVSSSEVPIYINCETGDLVVTGWDGDQVQVKFNVAVAADDERTARAFTNDIEAKLYSKGNSIYVMTHFPSLSNTRQRIAESRMIVRVPYGNGVTCENSFGTVNISEISGGLRLNANYCKVHLEDIAGGIDAVNKMSPMTVTDSPGNIKLKNELGEIFVSDCRGELDIENSYSSVQVNDCVGPVVIRNSGLVHVRDHRGKVSVENSNGVVQVTDLVGDLTAVNSFKPVFVSEVEGSVDIRNMSSSVELSYISGSAKVNNQFGTITGKYMAGPFTLENQNGTVTVEVYEELAGPSKIHSDFGTVNLILNDGSNVLLKASTEGGSIRGSTGKVVFSKDNVRSTEVKFGRAVTLLDVTTTYSTIQISNVGDI